MEEFPVSNIPDYVRPGGRSYVSPEGIIYCTDGKVRWAYELDQCKRPTRLLSLLYKWIAVGAAVGVLILLLEAAAGGAAALLSGLPVLPGLMAAGAVVALVSFGVQLLQGGRVVCLLFTMDEQSISCRQVKGENDKEKVTHAFAVWVGGQSQPALQFCSLREARFDRVTAIEADQTRHSIKLRGAERFGAVLVEPQQFRPVLNHLKEQCLHIK